MRKHTFIAPYTRAVKVRGIGAHHCSEELVASVSVDVRAYYFVNTACMLVVQFTVVIEDLSRPLVAYNSMLGASRLQINRNCVAVERLDRKFDHQVSDKYVTLMRLTSVAAM